MLGLFLIQNEFIYSILRENRKNISTHVNGEKISNKKVNSKPPVSFLFFFAQMLVEMHRRNSKNPARFSLLCF